MKTGENILPFLLFYATIFEGLTGELKDLTRLFMHFNKFQAASNQVEEILGDDEMKAILISPRLEGSLPDSRVSLNSSKKCFPSPNAEESERCVRLLMYADAVLSSSDEVDT